MLCNSYKWNVSLLFGHQGVSDFCDPVLCSPPGSTVPHHLLEFAPKFMAIDLQEQHVCSGWN